MIKSIFKTFIVLFLGTLAMPILAQRTASMIIGSNVCHYDTLINRPVGPGATYSKFQFSDIYYQGRSYKMRMYLLSVDLSNPYIKITPYLSKNTFYAISPQQKEVARMKQEGLKPIATIMGGGFEQSNVVTDTTTAYEMVYSLVGDGRVLYDDGRDKTKLSIDNTGIAHVSKTSLSASLSFGSTSLTIGQINHHREVGDAMNSLSLFCNGIPKSLSASQMTGVDVRVKVNSNNGNIVTGQQNECTVIEVLKGCGNKLNAGEAIISCGSRMASELEALKLGDAVNIKIAYNTPDTTLPDVQSLVTCYSSDAIIDGEILSNTTKYTAGVMAGCSKDGRTVYLADLEISSYSNAPFDCLSYAMRNFGVWNSFWLDGGPSAEMTVDGSFVTTNSIGIGFNGRYIPSAIAVMSTAPDDNTITNIEILDPTAKQLYSGDKYTPVVYAYNKYGEMIMPNAQASSYVQMSCDEGLGIISNGVFTAKTPGTGFIRISLVGSSEVISVPITVKKSRRLSIYPKKIFTGEFRECQASVSLVDEGNSESLDPWNAQWYTDADIVIGSCDDGLISPFLDGVADVYATYNELQDTVEVTVENLEDDDIDMINFHDEVNGQTNIEKHLPSVPTSFRITVESAPESTVSVFYTCGDSTYCISREMPESGRTSINVTIENSDEINITAYPVSVDYISGSNLENLAGEAYPYVIRDLTAYYHYVNPVGISEVKADVSAIGSSSLYNLQGMKVSGTYHGIVIKNGKKYLAR